MMDTSTHILLVEDDDEVRRLVSGLIEKEGYRVTAAPDARAMDVALAMGAPDLVILDVMLPGEDGLSICRRLRLSLSVPILMLTAKSDEIDRVLGLEMGADDYLVKPFGPRELVARIRALLRRAAEPVRSRPDAGNKIGFDGFEIDFDTRVVTTPPGDVLSLTSAEFDLLTCFVKRPRRVLSRETILDFVHGRNADPFDRSVDMLVSRLRRKLDAVDGGAGMITTIRNGGYLFTAKDVSPR
ncbi:MAG TPA: response regulator transcription factor [Ensifer sp.]|nr:response regulator transcription factor [Ensifer sp.]